MNKIKALVAAICVIALGGGVITVSNALAASVSDLNATPSLDASNLSTVHNIKSDILDVLAVDDENDSYDGNNIGEFKDSGDMYATVAIGTSSNTRIVPQDDNYVYDDSHWTTGTGAAYIVKDLSKPMKIKVENSGYYYAPEGYIKPIDMYITYEDYYSYSYLDDEIYDDASNYVRLWFPNGQNSETYFFYVPGVFNPLSVGMYAKWNIQIVDHDTQTDLTTLDPYGTSTNYEMPLFTKDMDGFGSMSFYKEEINKLYLPACESTDLTQYNVGGTCDEFYYPNYPANGIPINPSTYPAASIPDWPPTDDYSRTGVFTSTDSDNGKTLLTAFDAWGVDSGNNKGNVDFGADGSDGGFEVILNTTNFSFFTGHQEMWAGYTDESAETTDTGRYENTGDYNVGGYSIPLYATAKQSVVKDPDGNDEPNGQVYPGATIHYTLYFQNLSLDKLSAGLNITDVMPDEVELVPASVEISVLDTLSGEFNPRYATYMTSLTSGDTGATLYANKIPASNASNWTDYAVIDPSLYTNASTTTNLDITLNTEVLVGQAIAIDFDVDVKDGFGGEAVIDNTVINTAVYTHPTETIPAPIEVANPYGDIALKMSKNVDDNSYTCVPTDENSSCTEGIIANGDTYVSSEEWLNYTITITNKSSDGATVPVEQVQIVDDIGTEINLEKLDVSTVLVTSNTRGDITSLCTDVSSQVILDVTIPYIAVDEQITITFKAQAV